MFLFPITKFILYRKNLWAIIISATNPLQELNTSSKAFKTHSQDSPGGAVVKNLPASAGDTGSSPGLGRSHMPQSN